MSIEDTFDTVAENIFRTIGVLAIYTPSVGDPVPDIYVNLVRGTDPEPENYTKVWGQNITIEAILSDLGKEPNMGETFTISEVVYTVQTVEENDGRFVKMVVK